MSLQIGIVGLPNVGKSTLFKALTRKQVPAENYPFCTIDPNVGVVAVPDRRLEVLSKMSHSKKIIPAAIEFVDIAGLVAGAAQGEGLGNKFLSHIRECDAIAHVVREFTDSNVIHVAGKIEPHSDATIISTELALADMTILEKTKERLLKQSKSSSSKELDAQISLCDELIKKLNEGRYLGEFETDETLRPFLKSLNLISTKPSLFVRNVDENSVKEEVETFNGVPAITVCAKLEAELSELPEEDAQEMLQELEWKSSGLDRVISAAYKTLRLRTFLTTGEMETRAWTVRAGAKAPEAAGVIHTDFIKGFVRAEVISYEDLVSAGSWSLAREKGVLRTEGKEYEMQDGDVVHFLIA